MSKAIIILLRLLLTTFFVVGFLLGTAVEVLDRLLL